MNWIAVDLETTVDADKDILITSVYTDEAEFAWCYGIPEGRVKELMLKADGWITHNGTNFDLPLLLIQSDLELPEHVFDTLIGEGCILTSGRSSLSRSLANTLNRHKMPPKLSIDHKGWNQRPLSDEQIEYLVHDVQALHRLMADQRRLARARGTIEAMEEEMVFSKAVAQMIANGMPLNIDAYNIALETNRDTIAKLSSRLEHEYGYAGSPRSAQKVKDFVKARTGHVIPDTKKGTLAIEAMYDEGVECLLQLRDALKQESVYDDKFLAKHLCRDHKVRSNFRQVDLTMTRCHTLTTSESLHGREPAR